MNWWRRLTRPVRMEAHLENELSFHLEAHAADLEASGMSPKEARRQARIALGGPEQVKEECRDARGTRWADDFQKDVRYALRGLRQRPGFAWTAILTLALGIGGTTVMFTVVNSVLLKPLPYREPSRLAVVQEKTEQATQWGNLWAFAYPNFLDCRRESRSLEMASWRYRGGTITRPGEPDYAEGREISAGLFRVLGVPMLLGREFRPDEDLPGATPVAVVSYSVWQGRLGAGEAIGARTVVFEGKSYTVVGVTPRGFRLMGDDVDVFTPIGQDTSPSLEDRSAHRGIQVVARLNPGIQLDEARSELAVIGRQLAQQYPKSNQGRSFVVDPLRPPVGDVRGTLLLLLGAVSVVLLIACVNLAGLLLARAVSRERELAMRVALGASRGRLIRQCLTESTVLALCGGTFGLILAIAGLRPFMAIWPGILPRAEEIRLDWHVLVFALGVSLSSGILFGLAPALRTPVRELERTLRGARTVSGTARLQGAFVVAEIALAVVLLASAGMLGRTLLRLSSLETGINESNVLTARMALSPASLESAGRTRAAWNDVLERAHQVPGVQAVAMVDTVPMRAGNNQIGYWTTPSEPPATEQPLALATSVTPEYLNVMGIALREGRFFNEQDRLGSEPVAVVDEVLAQQNFGGNAIGRHLWIGLGTDPLRIVGVVRHVRYWGPAGDDQSRVRAQIYYPFAHVPDRFVRRWSELMSIAVRTDVPPFSLVEPLRRQLRGTGADQVLYETRTMEDLVASTLATQRFLLLLFGIFGAFALILACTGVYGVLAYLTNRRVPEFGVRMALGASAADVVKLVLRQSFGMIAAGVCLGAAGAAIAGRILVRLVEGLRFVEPTTIALLSLAMIIAVLPAILLPAYRASQADPLKALRPE